MKCQGEFVYKGINHTEAGTFINDKGEPIHYKGSYKIKVDEKTENGIMERIFKIAEDETALLKDFQTLEEYQKITIAFDIIISGTSVRLVPTDVQLV